MDGLLRYLFLLCAIIAPGHSLSCVTCVGVSSCTGSTESCLSGYVCGLAYREVTEGSSPRTDYIRSCVAVSKCNKVGIISYTGGKQKMGITCCETDNCTPSLPTFPVDSSQVKELYCPTCRSQTEVWCSPKTYIQCTGNQQTCVLASTMTTAFNESAMGCTTSDVCDVAQYFYMDSSNYYILMAFSCFSGTTNPGSSTVTGTSCTVCSSTNSLTCTGPLQIIPSNNNCASAYRITTINGHNTYEVIRSWAPVSKCNTAGTMTVMSGVKYSMGISCCVGDACTPTIVDATSTSTLSNGVQCKTCTSANSGYCETTNTMTCTGYENQCVTYAVTQTQGSYSATSAVRGCSTKTLCDVQSFSSVLDLSTVEHRFTCASSITTPSIGQNSITTPSSGGNSITSQRNEVFFLSTAAVILFLHQFHTDP